MPKKSKSANDSHSYFKDKSGMYFLRHDVYTLRVGNFTVCGGILIGPRARTVGQQRCE